MSTTDPATQEPDAPPAEAYDSGPDGTDVVHVTERADEPEDVSLPIGKFRRYKELREMADQAEAEFKGYKEEANKLELELIDAFADAGVNNIRLDGKTIYLHRTVYARRCEGVTAEDVKAALRAAGAEDLVTETVNANTLSAWVRELTDDDGPGLPAPVVGVLEPGERFGVRINAAGSRPKNKTHSK